MNSWQEGLLGVTDGARCEHAVFQKIEVAAVSQDYLLLTR